MEFKNSLAFAQELDKVDPLRKYRDEFHFPKTKGKDVIYFTGNSLGLQPKRTQKFVDAIMKDWKDMAVEGHFHAEKPWWDYHERLAAPLAKVVGAKTQEVSVMNTLTVNLHMLMVSFYRPTQRRFKIICEEKAFPSDQYMLASQVKFHGFDPNTAIVEVRKRPGENFWHTQDIIDKINEVGEELAVVLIGGVNYYNGQVFNMEAITRAAKAQGAFVGWDLAHAVGNVALNLHDWGADFAAWCSYKYMNSGPGNASGIFVHEIHLNNNHIPRFEGWWGAKKETRFLMKPEFEPMENADAWQVSNPSVLSLAPYLASLEMFEEVGMEALISKRNFIVAYLEFILQEIDKETEGSFQIITPPDRGCQLSVFLHGQGKDLFHFLMENGVITDWREPNVIRLAPAPFYCSFADMYNFGQILKSGILAKG
ncbi:MULTISPECIES: kynureninase [unclassified Arenibacter]|uniref:kynureninase n=1 Tax=unclassified Arenibacter TaxID=2615047 RepID=UPI000E34368F|nr:MULTISPECIES: kynureninase [unclassified Arenibacter]MCM4164174.1 kynureninase [Arenibacter sp. A80]RFT55972.1 kynureninase [Arenibacter sp. P308M17]